MQMGGIELEPFGNLALASVDIGSLALMGISHRNPAKVARPHAVAVPPLANVRTVTR